MLDTCQRRFRGKRAHPSSGSFKRAAATISSPTPSPSPEPCRHHSYTILPFLACHQTCTIRNLYPKPLQAKAKVNVGFWGGITPQNAHKHDQLWSMLKAGALGFKSFMSPSGINDFENVSRSDVQDAMHFLLTKGAPYFVHAELVTDVEPTEVRPMVVCR